jgi:hypothetical protein
MFYLGAMTGIELAQRPHLGDGSPERALFLELVLSLRPDHFQPSDAVLLTAFCRAAIMERTAFAALAKSGYVDADGEPSGWLKVLTQSQRSLTTMSGCSD